MTAGLNSAYRAPAPNTGPITSVRVMTQEEAALARQNLARYQAAMQKVEASEAKIAEAQAGQAAARARADEARAKIAEARAQHVGAVDRIITGLQTIRASNQSNPSVLAKIDAICKDVVTYKNNIPDDAAEQQRRMAEFKERITLLLKNGSK